MKTSKMKKVLFAVLTLIIAFSLVACGKSNKQEIVFDGIKMEIPKDWTKDEAASNDNFVSYVKQGKDKYDFNLSITKTESPFATNDKYTIDQAANDLTLFTTSDPSIIEPSTPEVGKFAGKYDMLTVKCKASIPDQNGGVSEYYAKMVNVYKDKDLVQFLMLSSDDDFAAFDEAIKNATVE